jgi:hypothetical protein
MLSPDSFDQFLILASDWFWAPNTRFCKKSLLNKSFNEQQPSHLDPTQSNQLSSRTVTYYNQLSEISATAVRQILKPRTTLCM